MSQVASAPSQHVGGVPLELADFANSIRTGATPRSHADLGYEIVAAVKAAETSLRSGGEPTAIEQLTLA